MLGRSTELEEIGQALRRPDLVGAVLYGAPGAGKSTLLDVAAARAAAQGFEVVRLHANRAMSSIPLFVLSPLIASVEDAPTMERFVAIRNALAERAQHRPLLVAIDDAHELDDASAVLLSQLARELTAFVLAAVRADEPTPEPIAALWTQGIAVRIELHPLARTAAAEVAESVLGGVIDPALEAEIWRRAAGNPLHIREIILGSRAAGALSQLDGVWSRTGTLVTSDALIDLVARRVGALAPDVQAALCAVALAEPAGVALIESVASADALIALEEAGLVKVSQDRRRLRVEITHPLYGEAARATTSQLRVRQLRLKLASTVSGWGSRRLDDLIQVAVWRLDAHDPDVGLFAGAAFEALRRNDIDLAERLAVAAHDQQSTGLSARALAMTRHLLGRHDDALQVLDTVLQGGGLDAPEQARVRLLQGLVLARGVGDYDRALAALDAIGDGASPRVHSRAAAMLALISLLQGHAGKGLHDAQQLVDAGATEPEAYTAFVGSMAVAGRPAAALQLADRYVAEHGEPDPRSLFPDFRWVGLIESGGVRQMEREVDDAWHGALDSGDRNRQPRLAFALGHLHLDTGRLTEAKAWFERSVLQFRGIGERFGIRGALCGQLLAAGLLGDLAGADAAAAQLAEVPRHPAELFEHYGTRGMAWVDAHRGQTRRACDELATLATRLIDNGEASYAVRTLVDLARLGDPERAARLMPSASDLDGELLPVCIAYVDAVLHGAADRLANVSQSFEAMGYGALALASAAAARDEFTRAGRKRDAGASAQTVKRLTLETGGAAGLLFAEPEHVVPLTRREREIAHLVANGHTSREVAESCFLSVRTVENHLARIYDKLGVRSRNELATAIRPLLAEGVA